MFDFLLSVTMWGTIASNIFLGTLVYLKNRNKATNIFFVLFAFECAVWAISLYFFQHPMFLSSETWLRICYLTVSILLSFFVLFSIALTDRNKSKSFKIPAIILSLTAAPSIYFVLSGKYFLAGVIQESWGYEQILGPYYPIFGFWAIATYVWAVLNFFIGYRTSDGIDKMRFKYLFVGMFFFTIFPLYLDVILPVFFGNSRYIWFSPVSSVFLIGFITYTIIVHRLMDIRLVIARTFAYSLLLVFISVLYAGTAFFISSLLLGSSVKADYLMLYTFLTVVIALSFDKMRLYIENLTDKVFFKGIYDPNDLLTYIGSIMSTTIELEPLTRDIIETLTEQMRISKGAIVIFGEGLASIYDIIGTGFTHPLSTSYHQISGFFPFSQIIVFDEVEEGSLKNLMREMDISVVKTMKVHDEVVGVLLLGQKASGEIYSEQDLRVLEILAPEMAIAIKNSQDYDKIKKFNVILSEEVKKATSELQDANDRLQTVDKLKDDFVSIASHELRTPMTAIRSYAWMALHRADVPLSKNLEKYLARILLSTERLINLVNDMLNVSRIESERIEINPEPIDLLLLIKDIIDEVYYSKSEEKNLQFVVLEKPVPKAFADSEKLRQVFLNLVGNSLKFTPSGGKITFNFFSDGKVVEVSIADTGVGISKDDISKLFHKFGRLDNSYTASATSGGTGLGLYISKRLVELMHGKIWAQSEGLNKGATFTVALPIVTPELLENKDKFAIKPKEGTKELEPVAI